MKLHQQEIESFSLAELNTYDLSFIDLDKQKALKEISQELQEEFDDLNSEETTNARLEHFKVHGAKASDYQEKILFLDDERKALYGIRNLGGNPEIPFIQLRTNFDLKSKNECLDLYNTIKDEFKVFNPLYISLSHSTKFDADFYGQIHMVSSVKSVSEMTPWPSENDIEFEQIKTNSFYEWYKNGYEEFNKDMPHLKDMVKVNDLSTMRESLNQELLKYVFYKGERIGLIAAESSDFLGHSGVYFNEIFITKTFKGKGLAKNIQRKFIQDYCRYFQFVWGTIDAKNLPSYKTAFANGRRPVRYECFIKLT